ncbi:CLIP-associated protein [Porphyridium purpureum]|uniref:CLIP-associated protein n=1 Tax=Porphyridium purpureum TaxID=35688 RepID=A0A5J4Z1P8_PORPP|nr:CLIP-associated protein [Porphyridium purpureum]|eukprot:POR4259..scf208_2
MDVFRASGIDGNIEPVELAALARQVAEKLVLANPQVEIFRAPDPADKENDGLGQREHHAPNRQTCAAPAKADTTPTATAQGLRKGYISRLPVPKVSPMRAETKAQNDAESVDSTTPPRLPAAFILADEPAEVPTQLESQFDAVSDANTTAAVPELSSETRPRTTSESKFEPIDGPRPASIRRHVASGGGARSGTRPPVNPSASAKGVGAHSSKAAAAMTRYAKGVDISDMCITDDALQRETNELASTLAGTSSAAWDGRVAAIQRIRVLVLEKNAAACKSFPVFLHELVKPLVTQISDLRSAVVKEACETTGCLAETVPALMRRYAAQFLRAAFGQVIKTTKIMEVSGDELAQRIVASIALDATVSLVSETLEKATHKVLREHCAAYILLVTHRQDACDMLKTDEENEQTRAIERAILLSVRDQSALARKYGCEGYEKLLELNPSRAARIYTRLDPSTQRRLARPDILIPERTASSLSSTPASAVKGPLPKQRPVQSISSGAAPVQTAGVGSRLKKPTAFARNSPARAGSDAGGSSRVAERRTAATRSEVGPERDSN